MTIARALETDVEMTYTVVLAVTDEQGQQSSVSRTATAHPPIESGPMTGVLFWSSGEPVRGDTTDLAIHRKADGDVVDICVCAAY